MKITAAFLGCAARFPSPPLFTLFYFPLFLFIYLSFSIYPHISVSVIELFSPPPLCEIGAADKSLAFADFFFSLPPFVRCVCLLVLLFGTADSLLFYSLSYHYCCLLLLRLFLIVDFCNNPFMPFPFATRA